jgi:hypothetical protein
VNKVKLNVIDPSAPRGHLYDIIDTPEHRTHGIEVETGEFLYGLVRVMKPQLILESGTGYGGSTRYLAQALEANDRGWLVTYESNEEYFGKAEKLPRTQYLLGSTLDWQDAAPDLVFLDSAPISLRLQELRYWRWKTAVVVHDTRLPEIANVIYQPREDDGGLTIPVPLGLWVKF